MPVQRKPETKTEVKAEPAPAVAAAAVAAPVEDDALDIPTAASVSAGLAEAARASETELAEERDQRLLAAQLRKNARLEAARSASQRAAAAQEAHKARESARQAAEAKYAEMEKAGTLPKPKPAAAEAKGPSSPPSLAKWLPGTRWKWVPDSQQNRGYLDLMHDGVALAVIGKDVCASGVGSWSARGDSVQLTLSDVTYLLDFASDRSQFSAQPVAGGEGKEAKESKLGKQLRGVRLTDEELAALHKTARDSRGQGQSFKVGFRNGTGTAIEVLSIADDGTRHRQTVIPPWHGWAIGYGNGSKTLKMVLV